MGLSTPTGLEVYKKTTHTPGSGQQTEPRTRAEPNKAKYRGTQPKRLAATAAWAAGAGRAGVTPGQGEGGRDRWGQGSGRLRPCLVTQFWTHANLQSWVELGVGF